MSDADDLTWEPAKAIPHHVDFVDTNKSATPERLAELKKLGEEWLKELRMEYEEDRPEAEISKRRHLCDAFYRALCPRPDDGPGRLQVLANIALPPPPTEMWFWERVSEEYEELEREYPTGKTFTPPGIKCNSCGNHWLWDNIKSAHPCSECGSADTRLGEFSVTLREN